MAWVKAVSGGSEDVFDETGDELQLQSKEWKSNMEKRVKEGYVDGVEAGQEAATQIGFNQGFREGAARTVSVGRLKGIICAIRCWFQIQHPESPVPPRVTELLQRVAQHEDKILADIRQALENPPPSVSDVAESMEDLGVEQPAAGGCCGEGCGDEAAGCCNKGDKMELDVPQQPPQTCSASASRSSRSSDEDLSLLLQSCMELVSGLGLPQELLCHIEELKNV